MKTCTQYNSPRGFVFSFDAIWLPSTYTPHPPHLTTIYACSEQHTLMKCLVLLSVWCGLFVRCVSKKYEQRYIINTWSKGKEQEKNLYGIRAGHTLKLFQCGCAWCGDAKCFLNDGCWERIYAIIFYVNFEIIRWCFNNIFFPKVCRASKPHCAYV